MPYIKQEQRATLAANEIDIETLTPGDVNYLITKFIRDWWLAKPSYYRIAEITGVLENVKQEFYRRVASPYEDKKIAENGDVY